MTALFRFPALCPNAPYVQGNPACQINDAIWIWQKLFFYPNFNRLNFKAELIAHYLDLTQYYFAENFYFDLK